jgi:hypothetical protein
LAFSACWPSASRCRAPWRGSSLAECHDSAVAVLGAQLERAKEARMNDIRVLSLPLWFKWGKVRC